MQQPDVIISNLGPVVSAGPAPSQPVPTANAARFLAAYEADLTATIRRKPADYAMRAGETPEAAAAERSAKMVRSILSGGDVNVSDSMRRVAKRLGVGTTREAIFAFIRQAAP